MDVLRQCTGCRCRGRLKREARWLQRPQPAMYEESPPKTSLMPRRIAYVLKVFPKISETFIAEELAELRRRGVEVRILSLLAPRAEIRHDIVASAGLDQLTSYEPREFSSIVQGFRPQILHAHFATEATAMAIELATDHGIPFTFTAHGYDIHRKAPTDFGARAVAAKAVVTVSQA